MTIEVWLAFVAASAFLLVIPGPTVTLVISYALAEGRRSGWHTVAGVTLGDFVSMTLSLLGLGALLAASATLFAVFKWGGAAYLVFLGIRMWRTRPAVADDGISTIPKPGRAMFTHAFLVTASNPKTIAFFVAFLPQFISASAPVLPQIIILEATFLVLAAINTAAYALLASRAREAIGRPAFLKRLNRIGGSLLIGAGIMTAALRRTQ
ncbi:MAG: LysE family translocator [Rhodospirillales bacterium]|nr:LysE family translocator [Rhodospirillales bacterium]